MSWEAICAIIGACITLAGALAGVFHWVTSRGGNAAENKLTLMRHGHSIETLEADMSRVKIENILSIQDRTALHAQLREQGEKTDKNVDALRSELNRRLDRQDDKLDRIGERLGVPSTTRE